MFRIRRVLSSFIAASAFALAPAALATPLDVYDSSDLSAPIGQIESFVTSQTGAQHYDFRSDSGHPAGVNLSNFHSNIWVHENQSTGEFSFGFIFAKDAANAPSNSASFRFRIVDSTGNVQVVVSDDPGEAVESSPGVFAGTFSYGNNTDGIMVSGLVGTGWTIIIDSVNFGNVTHWYAASDATPDFTDDLSLTLGREYRITPASNAVVSAQPVDPTDQDGDGATNGLDLFPCDPSAVSEAFAPAEGQHGLFLVEDQWPEVAADLDFNDVAVAYNFAYLLDVNGDVTSMRVNLHPLALGGQYDNGLALHLPVPSTSVGTVTRQIGAGAPQALMPSGADTELTVVVSTNLRELFGDASGQLNSVAGQAPVNGQAMEVVITFAQPVALAPAGAPYDLFIMRTQTPSHEIHRPEFAGSAAMDASLFGTGIDGSTPTRHYVDQQGLPVALLLPDATPWPLEATPIHSLFPDIASFAASGGATHADFYASTVNLAFAYAEPGTPTATFAQGDGSWSVDTSCLPPVGQTPDGAVSACLAILQGGGSTGDGIYWIDPDGTNGNPAFQVFCDMTTDGGGWTIIANNDNGDNEPNGCIPRIGSDPSFLCGAVEPFSDFVVPAYGMQFTELAWVAYSGYFNASSYQYMTWTSAQTVPHSAGRWGLQPTASSQIISDWTALPLIECTYYSSSPGLRLVGNEFPRGGAYGTNTPVTIFDSNANFDDPGHMGMTEYNPWSSTQASMYGLDDFQDGHGCGDSWRPKADRGASTFIMIR